MSFCFTFSPERVQSQDFRNGSESRNKFYYAIDRTFMVFLSGARILDHDYYQLRYFQAALPDVPIIALTASATPFVLV